MPLLSVPLLFILVYIQIKSKFIKGTSPFDALTLGDSYIGIHLFYGSSSYVQATTTSGDDGLLNATKGAWILLGLIDYFVSLGGRILTDYDYRSM